MKFSEIVLFGMPNSGKSTVFNALTKGDAKIGNWHGVTVEIKEGLLK
ncbi:MAG: 50S ribosome-binding GTPase, partial [Clostridia bacterium]|nr:50S ribosome-binding GTPase [Clostridia bacterium]